jgi:FKBP-type peptidyl-prolyl cis-trans isomerase
LKVTLIALTFVTSYMPGISIDRSVFIFAIIFYSCNQHPERQQSTADDMEARQADIKEQFMDANRRLMQKEEDEMDYYAVSHRMPFIRTKSGIRYFVYKPSEKGDSIRDGNVVTLGYKVFLLDGTLCYSSDQDGKRTIIIGQEQIESGIHKGLQYLKRGDRAILLIPSPLAHGLLGDFKKIPPQMSIVYDVQVE